MLCGRIRFFAVVVFSLLGICSRSQAQNEFQVTGGGFRTVIEMQIKSELDCLRLVADVTDDQTDTIFDELDEFIDEKVDKINEAVGDGNPFAGVGIAGGIADAVLVEAKDVLEPKAFKAYEADVALRTKFQRRAGQRALLSALDGYLQLSNKQQVTIAKLIMSSWKDDWNGLGQMGGAAAGLIMLREPIKELPQEKLKSAMSESQWAALQGMLELDVTAMADQVSFAELQGKASGMLKLEEMTTLCKLAGTQTQKLKTVMDDVLEASVERKADAMQALQAGNFQGNMDALRDLGLPVQKMMFEHEDWTNALKDVLDENQVAKYTARQKSRDKRNASTFVSAMATGLAPQAGGLTGKQMVSFAKLLEKELAGEADPFSLSMKLAEIEEAKYKKILNDEQWEKFSNVLQMMRRQFQAADGDGDN